MPVEKFYSMEEIERRKRIYTRVWNLEDIGRPAFNLIMVGDVPYSVKRFMENPSYLLEYQISGLEARSKYKSDCPPFLYPWVGVTPLASAFGCKTIFTDTIDPKSEPLLEKSEDVYKLRKPKTDAGQMGMVLDQLKYLKEANQGYYDIRMHDLQSPFSVASMIWGFEDFLTAVYTNPDEVHYLIKLVTEYIIDVVETQKAIVPDLVLCHCAPEWSPQGVGIAVSDDDAAVISPRIFEEFVVPYNNIISDYFGGILIHSCGNSSANFEASLKLNNFRGFNFELSDIDYPEAVKKLGRRSLIAPYPGLQVRGKYGNLAGYVRYMLETTPPGTPYFLTLFANTFNPTTVIESLDQGLDEAMDIRCSLIMD